MNALAGTAALTRLALRRDRVNLPLWILGLAAFTAGTTAMSATGFASDEELAVEVRLQATNAGLRLLGLASGASVGAYTMIRDYLTLALLAALMSTFAVVRHTRQTEETGRVELTGAAVVGRHAGLAAALTVTVAANVVLAGAIGLAMFVIGEPAAGSFTAGAAVALVGIVFAGVSAVTVQLAASTRGASGLSAAVLGAAFLASGVGNMTGDVDPSGLTVHSGWPVWLSPIGWGQQMRAFDTNQWWPVLLGMATFVVTTALAGVLATRRDVGQGMVAQRPGPGVAGRTLRSATGLAFRLQRNALLGWLVGMLGFGLVLGAVIGQVDDFGEGGVDWYAQVGGSNQILDAFRAALVEMAGMAASVYAVQVLLRARAEEAGGQAESVLAAAIGRSRWIAGHAVTALFGTIAVMVAFAVGAGTTAGAVLGDPAGQIATMLRSALVQLPAIGVVGAATLALVGIVPRLAPGLSWSLMMVAILLGPVMGPSLQLPQWAENLSPFTHAPKVPAVPVSPTALVGLTAAAAVLVAAAVLSLRRRDLALPS